MFLGFVLFWIVFDVFFGFVCLWGLRCWYFWLFPLVLMVSGFGFSFDFVDLIFWFCGVSWFLDFWFGEFVLRGLVVALVWFVFWTGLVVC